MDILQEIVAHKRIEVESQKAVVPPAILYDNVEKLIETEATTHRSMRKSLLNSTSGIIAEFKRKSPSKGWIKEEGKPDVIPASYCQNGASAISILTDEKYFGGSLRYVRIARPMVACPILRKDFIVDEYQVFEAKEIGADAVLLIAACLTKEECRTLAHCARQLELEVLLEVHDERELDYLGDDVSVVGVNNRDLHVFQTTVQTSVRLAPKIPEEFVRISESGIRKAEDLRLLRQCGYQGFLMGERFMREADPAKALQELLAS